MKTMTEPMHSSADTQHSPGDALASSLERAWGALRLYGDGHRAVQEAIEQVVATLHASGQAEVCLAPTPRGLESDRKSRDESLLGVMHAMDVGVLKLTRDATGEDIYALLRVLREARGDRTAGRELAARVSDRVGAGVSVEPHQYERLADRVSAHRPETRPRSGTGLSTEDLRGLLRGDHREHEPREIARIIERQLTRGGADAEAVTNEILAAAQAGRDAGAEAGSGRVERIRGVLSLLDPQIRARLAWTERAEDGDPLERLAGLADVLPVRETCDALASAELTPESLCDSTLMMIKRMACLAGNDRADLEHVEAAASTLIGVGAETEAARSLEALRDLCSQARREEFTPEDYLARLHEISLGADTRGQALSTIEWDSTAVERVHAAEISVTLLEQSVGGPEGWSGQLERLASSVEDAARLGRTDLLMRIGGVADELGCHAAPRVRDGACSLAHALDSRDVQAIAVGAQRTLTDLDRHLHWLRERSPGSSADIMLRAFTRSEHPSVRDWLTPHLASLGSGLVTEIRGLLSTNSEGVNALVPLLNAIEGEDAFASIQPALLDTRDHDSRRRVYAAAYRLKHPWPTDLMHRALVDSDERIRSLAIAYVVKRADPRSLRLLSRRLLHALGGETPDDRERSLIVTALTELGTVDARRALRHALIGAAWRPVGWTPSLGSRIRAALASDESDTQTRLACTLWALSPNRVIAGARRSSSDAA